MHRSPAAHARLAPLALAAVAGLALLAAPARAQRCVAAGDMADNAAQNRWCGVPLITTTTGGAPLGGAAGFGDNASCLRQNDDGSGPRLDIAPYFPGGLRFFTATPHTSLFVNTNGNISFSNPLAQYTPDAFPVAPVANRPMIAPFWADVDIRMADGTCNEALGTTCTSCTPCFPAAENQVWWAFEPGRALFTWDEVGYYSCAVDRRQSFQLVLTAVSGGCGGGGDFDVEFRFNRCEWDTGNASGGTGGFFTGPIGAAAQAGFDSGNGTDFVEIMSSRVTRTINRTLCEDSNVGMPGIWQFQIRGGGVVCPDAGDPCTVPGAMGACAMGRTNCVGAGTECVQQVTPETEVCDNVDNDCNGMTDEGGDALLCGPGYVCRGGACVENCFESFCGGGLVCVDPGVCVEPGCETVMCPEGERCSAGTCVPACSGVTCPFGQTCTAGRCIDTCAGITCDDCTVCDEGSCAPRCTLGAACPAGEACDPSTGGCVDSTCVGFICAPGTHCAGGTCVDSCIGATCPLGQACSAGRCMAVERPDAGPGEDSGPPRPDGGPPFDAGVIDTFDAGPPAELDAGRPVRPPVRDTGCGCRVPSGEAGAPSGVALAALALALVVRRRRG